MLRRSGRYLILLATALASCATASDSTDIAAGDAAADASPWDDGAPDSMEPLEDPGFEDVPPDSGSTDPGLPDPGTSDDMMPGDVADDAQAPRDDASGDAAIDVPPDPQAGDEGVAPDPGPCPWDACECRGPGDCEPGRFCDEGICRDWICTPGERFCAGDLLVRCATDGSGVTVLQQCDDGDPCTVGDGCEDRACRIPVMRDCDDGDPCTQDRCDPVLECLHDPLEGPCDDGNPCTVGDLCVEGTCRGQAALDCDDGNPCTEDLCAPVVGCMHRPLAGPCDDGSACTVQDRCVEGKCIGTPTDCDDGDPCTADSCLTATGTCVNAPIPNCGPCGTDPECDDRNDCSVDRCVAGDCIHSLAEGCCKDARDCNDGDPCTTGACVGSPFGRCVQEGIDAPGCCASTVFEASFATGWDEFSAQPDDAPVGWRLATPPGGSGTTALYYGNATATGFDDGNRNAGQAVGPRVTLPAGVAVELAFSVWMDVEPTPGSDRFEVSARTAGDTYPVWSKPAGFPMGTWQRVSVPVDALAGRTAQWTFAFDSVDGELNDGRGIFITDIHLGGPCAPAPCATPGDCDSLGFLGDCRAGACDFARTLQALALWTGRPHAADVLMSPDAIAPAPDGNRFFISDKGRHRISVFDGSGRPVTTFGIQGNTPGRLNQPRGLAIDADRLLVADTGNHRIQAFTFSGVPLWTLGTRGAGGGQFEQPKDLTLSPDGDTLYVADTGNHRVQVFSRNGVFRFAFGAYGTQRGQFRAPSCVTTAADGTVLVCDTQNNRIQAFSPGGRWLRHVVPDDGTALYQPYGAVVLPDGTMVVVDSYNHGLVRMQPDGNVLARFGGYGDAPGRFAYPLGIARNGDGSRLFVADTNNSRVVVVGWAPLP